VACFAWGALSLAAAAPAAPAANPHGLPAPGAPAEASNDVPTLIRQLGDGDFRVREAATRRLREIGKSAVPALREALASGDPEVCSRADSLLRQIERPRIPPGWFRNFTDWRRRESVSNGTRVVEVIERERRVRVAEGPGGIEMLISGVDDGQNVQLTITARNADELRRKDPEAYDVYERVAGARANLNIRGRRLIVPGVPGGPLPVPMPVQPLPLPIPQRPQAPGARLLPLAPAPALRPPADDLLDLEARIRRQMRLAEVNEADQQAVIEALRMLRAIQQQGAAMPPADLEAQVKKYNALSDALRQKLEDLRLPGPGDALPPPARARLGVSVAAPGSDDAVANGVRVTMVSPGSRGEKLGLKTGDVIRKVNGKSVEDAAALRRTLTDTKESLVLDVERGGATTVLKEKPQ
jgi:hypothetical protein